MRDLLRKWLGIDKIDRRLVVLEAMVRSLESRYRKGVGQCSVVDATGSANQKNKIRIAELELECNRLELIAEEIECVNRWLNEEGIATEEDGDKLSIVGRIVRSRSVMPAPTPLFTPVELALLRGEDSTGLCTVREAVDFMKKRGLTRSELVYNNEEGTMKHVVDIRYKTLSVVKRNYETT